MDGGHETRWAKGDFIEIVSTHMVVSIAMGVPKTRWFIRENPNLLWMMIGGTPIYGSLHMSSFAPYLQDSDLPKCE